jgi:3-methylcrotonyl-CoA carboxylase alpha subunit
MFETVLIANRGEIACRITRTLRRLGIRAIAVYSDADRDARHVALADEAIRIGPAPAAESYLRIEAILDAARRSGAQAIHPGYGFLAENAGFARACADSGVVFIGPTPGAIEAIGAKDRAKALMEEAGVPLVPGYHGEEQDEVTLLKAAERIGFPVLLKAAAGGGGKGMRVVGEAGEFAPSLEGARREAKAAFGDERMLIERLITSARHVEVQVFGDRHGNVVHLFERDCSVQRRHQKVIEEAPAPGLSEEQRSALGAAAVQAARSIGYLGAGTIEFLMDRDGAFYFMEMNTRLQVEHPITEMITALDLVEWQLRVAAGELLPLAQEEITRRGHAIEARLYAEDPARGFLPSTGRLDHLHFPPEDAGLRVETGVAAGDTVTPFYDPMLAKLVAWAPDRAAAIRRLERALVETEIVGPTTNAGFLMAVLGSSPYRQGGVDTGFVDEAALGLLEPRAAADDLVPSVASLWLLARQRETAAAHAAESSDPHSPWHRVDGWRLNDVAHQTLRLRLGGEAFEIHAWTDAGGHRLEVGGREVRATTSLDHHGRMLVEMDGRRFQVRGIERRGELHLFTPRGRFLVERVDPLAAAESQEKADGVLTAPMPGKVIRQMVAEGDQVRAGAPLLVLEAMKMEHTVAAPADGRIAALYVAAGEQVEEGIVLLDFERATDASAPGDPG